MTTVAFIGLGNMGAPMARNLLKAGHAVRGFDVAPAAVAALVAQGATAAADVADAVRGAETVVTMLPAGRHVREVYTGAGGVIATAAKGALLIDCSTIDIPTAREVAAAAGKAGLEMLDAPVSGGVMGAAAGTLAMMVGGGEDGFQRALPLLTAMGRNIVHCGGPGNGQAAKMCNNMMLGIQMIGVCEAFNLADAVGLDRQALFDVAKNASGQCWSLTNYCPVPGPVPTSPANRDYEAGFTAAMMLKDLKLSQAAAQGFEVSTPLGAAATMLYSLYCNAGEEATDFSGILRMMRGTRPVDRPIE